MASEKKPGLSTWRVVIPYCAFATAWILLSDRMLAAVVPDVHTFARVGIIKGLGFVAISALLLHLLFKAERLALLHAQMERDELLQREQAARARAESANHAKDELLAIVSHELRTPLTPILAGVDLLQAELGNSEASQLLQRIRDNAMLEARIVGDLLDSTSLSSGKLNLALEEVRLDELLGSVVQEMGQDAVGRGIGLELAEAAAGLWVHADRARLRQVFRNLIENALKFTASGGRVEIGTSLQRRDGVERAVIEVRDTGIGIDRASQTRVFEAFEQGDRSHTRRFGGLGLGLYLARSIVELHQGRMSVQSDGEGKGSVFTLELPVLRVQKQPAKNTAATSAVPHSGSAKAKLGLSVLLVEDNPDTSRLLARVIKQMGCEVKVAGTCGEALSAARAGKFDVLVSDIGLPDRSGWDLMREIGPKHQLPGIAVSGFGSDDDFRRSQEAGFRKHLVKPVTFQDLRGALLEFVEQTPASLQK